MVYKELERKSFIHMRVASEARTKWFVDQSGEEDDIEGGGIVNEKHSHISVECASAPAVLNISLTSWV